MLPQVSESMGWAVGPVPHRQAKGNGGCGYDSLSGSGVGHTQMAFSYETTLESGWTRSKITNAYE